MNLLLTYLLTYTRLFICGVRQWLCKGIVALFNYLQSATYFWMLVEGLYLHTIIVCAFSAARLRLWYYVIIGWGRSIYAALTTMINFEEFWPHNIVKRGIC